ncbi:MAG: hypothetical protein ACYTEQ_21670 [Planctomycetota bacterium]|jgi:hypothetical protein
MDAESTCCDNLFTSFTFQDIRDASPPNKRGVYVIRVKRRGRPIGEMIEQIEQIIRRLGWPVVGKRMRSRIKRLEKIVSCPTIYIGSAGTQPGSRHTLQGRYRDFAGRHTAMYPLWALLYFGWELDYGWREAENSAELEERLKRAYKQGHNDQLPALVYR